ncbi:hypothetical protein CTEN210_12153 [Chaetoceros tenuissimus]|uniref:Ion transport domain-containing protein n=1 Tax=Chaetoceros tenuissimus TaxID=426638 RepID=A0AAD3D0N3_9STRA|nr:hypothetical protein CTEN210_12153 [Chaetoceros tenuissimus]
MKLSGIYGATSNSFLANDDTLEQDVLVENREVESPRILIEYGKLTNIFALSEDLKSENGHQTKTDGYFIGSAVGGESQQEVKNGFVPFLPRRESFLSRSRSRRTLYSDASADEFSDDAEAIVTTSSTLWKIHLIFTDPTSSKTGWICQLLIFVMIILSNIVLILQTVDRFEYVPDGCSFCTTKEQYVPYTINDRILRTNFRSNCECPPVPKVWLQNAEYHIMTFFALEWILRLITFDPPKKSNETRKNPIRQLLDFFNEQHTVLDLLAFLPYFLEVYALDHFYHRIHPSFHYLRIFRVFQLVRFGQYSDTFCKLVNVMLELQNAIGMLFVFVIFGGAFFGTIMYWLEQGLWEYTDLLDPPGFAHVRIGSDGSTEELSPFRSIPSSMWWFVVTVTRVGYGDMAPATILGKIVGVIVMFLGLLVTAFPISVFTNKWQHYNTDDFSAVDVKTKLRKGHTPFDERSVDSNDSSIYIEKEKEERKEEKQLFAFTDNSSDDLKRKIQMINLHMAIIDESQNKIADSQKKIRSLLQDIDVKAR